MAQIYYLDWAPKNAESVGSPDPDDAATKFFVRMHVTDGSVVEEVPRDWYVSVAEIPVDSVDAIWNSWQGDIEMGSQAFSTEAERRAHEEFLNVREEDGIRSMSVGDIIEVDGTLSLVSSLGFTDVEWGDAPDI